MTQSTRAMLWWGFGAICLLSTSIILSGCWQPNEFAQAQTPKGRAPGAPPANVFSGLPPMRAKGNEVRFRFRPGPRPPVAIKKRVTLPFPAKQRTPQKLGPQQTKRKALRVTRYRPTGRNKLVGAVTVSFNLPMIPLGSVSAMMQQKPPFTIKPQPKGRFRWLGTRTVSFEPKGRMPFATRYVVTIPKGTKALNGSVLAKQVRFTFLTPRPRFVATAPYRNRVTVPTTAVALQFNQAIKVNSLRRKLQIRVKGEPMRYSVVPRKAWKQQKQIWNIIRNWRPERTVVVKPLRALPVASKIEVRVAAGLRGQEGPRRSMKLQRYLFRTYSPLKVNDAYCSSRAPRGFFNKLFGSSRLTCRPRSSLVVRFNNSLLGKDLAKYITIKPKLSGLRLRASWRYLHISRTQGFPPRAKFTVRVKKGLQDTYGQKLAQTQTVRFSVGDAPPSLQFSYWPMALLEKQGPREFFATAQNLKDLRERIVSVEPSQVRRFLRLTGQIRYRKYKGLNPLSGLKLLVDRRVKIKAPPNKKWKHQVAIDKALGKKSGWLFVVLTSSSLASRWRSPHIGVLLQISDVGVTVRYGPGRIVGLVTGVESGKALADTTLSLYTYRSGHKRLWQGKTNAQGLVIMPGRLKLKARGPYLLVAQHKQDRSFVLINNGGRGARGYTTGYNYWNRKPPAKHQFASYVYTDRSPYKPGETVHLRGLLRRRVLRPLGGMVGIPDKKIVLSYTIRSPRYRVIKKGKLTLGAGLTFGLDIPLRKEADLGNYRFYARGRVEGKHFSVYHNFQVQAYRAPQYKVNVSVGKGPFLKGQSIQAKVQGRYFFGAPMKGAKVTWLLRRAQDYFRPPNQPKGFRFGMQRPWFWAWRHRYRSRYGRRFGYYGSRYRNSPVVARGQGQLNAKGLLVLKTRLKANTKWAGTDQFTLEAQVYDKNRQSIAGRKVFVAHASSLYPGLRLSRGLAKVNKPVKVEGLVASIAGQRIAGQDIVITAFQRRYKRIPYKADGSWRFKYKSTEVKATGCTIRSAAEIKHCSLRFSKAGSYTLRALVKDKAGRENKTQLSLYVAGPGYVTWKTNDAQRIELVPDRRKAYQPGQTARILIKSPFHRAIGLLTVERNGIAEYRLLRLKGSAQAVSVKIRGAYVPNVSVSVALLRGRVPLSQLGLKNTKGAEDLGRPSYAFGSVALKVALTEKEIGVKLSPLQAQLRPGGTLKLKIRTHDFKNRAVRALVSVAVVDEGVLSLLGFATPNPLKAMHSRRSPWAVLKDLRYHLVRQKPKRKLANNRRIRDIQQTVPASGGLLRGRFGRTKSSEFGSRTLDAAAPRKEAKYKSKRREDAEVGRLKKPSGQRQANRVRTKFATTAFFRGRVKTNRKGEATLSIKMPDNLTTFRVMAVAVDTKQFDRFGSGESKITLRKPLLLRPALPRFANFGDRFEAAVVINNETGKDGVVSVSTRAVNLQLLGASTKTVRIPAGEARELRFAAKVVQTGTARIQFAARLGEYRDAVEERFPVQLPASAEAFATYGTTLDSVAQMIAPPQDALPQFGGLKVSLSSTALTGLEDAVRYLVTYPYGCNEQLASRMIPVLALKNMLLQFKIAKLGNRKVLDAAVKGWIRQLVKRQRPDGGWGYWSSSRSSWLWISSYVTYALHVAQQKGYTVPVDTMLRARSFLKNRLNRPLLWERKMYTTQVMAAWVLSGLKVKVTGHLSRLYRVRRRLPLFAKAWLMVGLFREKNNDARVTALLRTLNNQANETSSSAHFSERKTESLRLLMHSEDRSDAIILQALLEVKPKMALIPKVVHGMMKARIRGRWSTTQSNAYATLALSRYFAVYEKTVPNFSVTNWLGQGFLGKRNFVGRSMKVVDQKIPMSFLQQQKSKTLTLAKRGAGRLYYRLGLRYAPKSLKLKPMSQGFTVKRTYEAVENKDDVVREKNGRWRFKAGAYVRVRLTVVSPGQRYHVALVDPLPAGLEAVNLAFRTSASSRLRRRIQNRIYDSYGWYRFFAFHHQEKRDDMVVMFANRLPAGVYEYTYLARATTIGRFVVPPTRVEEMYEPEVFGRDASMFADVVAP